MCPWNTPLSKRVPRNMCPLYDEPADIEPEFRPSTRNPAFPSFAQSPSNRIQQTVHPYDRGWATHHRSINPHSKQQRWENIDGFFEMDQLDYPYSNQQPDYTPEINQPYPTSKKNEAEEPPTPYKQFSSDTWHMEPQGVYTVPSSENEHFMHPGSSKTSTSAKATRWHPSTYGFKGHHPPPNNPMANISCTPRGVETSESNTIYQVFECSAPSNNEKNYAKIGKLYLENSLLQQNSKPGTSPLGVRIHRRGKNFKERNRKSSVYYRSRRPPRDTCSSSSAGSMRRSFDITATNEYSDDKLTSGFKSHSPSRGISSMSRQSPKSQYYSNTHTNYVPTTTNRSSQFLSLPKTSETQTENNSSSRKTQTATRMSKSRGGTGKSFQSFPTEDMSLGGYPFLTDPDQDSQIPFSTSSPKYGSGSRKSMPQSLSKWSSRKSDECPNVFGDLNTFIPGLFVLGVAVGFILCHKIANVQYSIGQIISSYC